MKQVFIFLYFLLTGSIFYLLGFKRGVETELFSREVANIRLQDCQNLIVRNK